MNNYSLLITILVFTMCTPNEKIGDKNGVMSIATNEFAIVVHGGAGYRKVNEERDSVTKAKLAEAMKAGYDILEQGGSAEDAVVATIKILEDSPLFNAGKGAVLTNEGKNELDASIMHGKELKAGAVGGITNVKNPITAAQAVMNHSKHVMMTNRGAEKFAIEQGLDTVPNSYFYIEERMESLKKAKALEDGNSYIPEDTEYKFGTVGCVALDKQGNIVAGTSTGGMTNKRYGRIGDSPIIGAGTYANNQTCGVSCTGHGEYFIRYAVAYDVSAMMEYKGLDLKSVANFIVNTKLVNAKAEGGLIAIDKFGRVVMPFNSPAMARGYMLPDGKVNVYFYKDEPTSSY
ncbi:MAG: isoaspartyl peptidase/L-asparaginase [Saprospiraceae bacterium]|nr:isoaspartyl peptidase/L-asparaginase [Saprospiraceae bacterium]